MPGISRSFAGVGNTAVYKVFCGGYEKVTEKELPDGLGKEVSGE